LWRLDLDDVGAQVAQGLGGPGPEHHRRDVDDPHAIERSRHERPRVDEARSACPPKTPLTGSGGKHSVGDRVTSSAQFNQEASMLTRRAFLQRSAVGTLAVAGSRARTAHAQDARTFTFAYDQPRDTSYSFMADTFEKKLGELSGGKLKIRQFPSAA